MSRNAVGIITFAPSYRVDARQYSITRDGQTVALPRIPMDILLLLLGKPGELVTRAEIANEIWPGSSPDDVMQGINTAVNRIRQVLRDDPVKPRFVETVIGKGYRFIAPIQVTPFEPAAATERTESAESIDPDGGPGLEPAPAPSEAAESPSAAASPKNKVARTVSLGLGAVLLLVIGCVVGFRHFSSAHASPALNLADLTRWTSSTSDNPVELISVSPDGKTLAYTDADGLLVQGRHDIAPTPLQAPAMKEMDRLTWLPDGKHIAVSGIARESEKPEVWEVSADGSSKPFLLRDNIRNLAVSSRARRIAYLNSDSTQVWEANLDGTGARLLRTAEGGTAFDQVLWAFGNSALLVEQVRLLSQKELETDPNASPSPAESTLMALNTETGTVTASARGYKVRDGCSLPGGRLMLEGLDEQHHSVQLSAAFRPDLAGLFESTPTPLLPLNTSVLKSCSVAEQTGETTLLLQTGHPAVYVGELADNDHQLLHPHPITSAEFGSYPHAWSADSKAVLYEQFHGKWYLFQQAVDRHDPQPLLQPNLQGAGARLSPDGRWILFSRSDASGSPQLYRIARQGKNLTQVPLPVHGADVRCPRVGVECVLRVRDNAAHSVGLYSLNPASGVTRLLRALPWEEASFTDWDVSPDGVSVVLCDSVSSKGVLRIVKLHSEEEHTEIFPVESSFRAVNWNSSGKGWFGVTYTKYGSNLYFLDPSHTATLLRKVTATATWGVPSPDGRALAFAELNQDRNVWSLQRP